MDAASGIPENPKAKKAPEKTDSSEQL